METRFLQTLLGVIETGSVSETARQLNVTPSAVVQRIKALEEEIGQRLVVRVGQTMRPSAAAMAALEGIRNLLSSERDVIALAGGSFDSGLLRVGVVPSVQAGILPDLLAEMQRDFPRIEIRIVSEVSNVLYERVNNREIELAIISKPTFRLSKDAVWSTLRCEKSVLLTGMDVVGDDPLELIQREPFIRYDSHYWSGKAISAWLRGTKLVTRELYELNSLDVIALLVHRGLGVSIVPDWMQPWPEGVRVRKLALPGAPEREIGMLWSRASTSLPLIRAFLGKAQKTSIPVDVATEAVATSLNQQGDT